MFYPGSLPFCLALLLGTAVCSFLYWSPRRWLAFHHGYKLPEIKQSRKINFGSWWSPGSTALRPVTRRKHHGGKRRSRDAHNREGRPELKLSLAVMPKAPPPSGQLSVHPQYVGPSQWHQQLCSTPSVQESFFILGGSVSYLDHSRVSVRMESDTFASYLVPPLESRLSFGPCKLQLQSEWRKMTVCTV